MWQGKRNILHTFYYSEQLANKPLRLQKKNGLKHGEKTLFFVSFYTFL